MNRTLRLLTLAAALAVGTGPAAFAHGGHEHVMGTVKAVDTKARTVDVEARDGKRVTVHVDDATRYLRGPEAAKADDLAVGLRVVVDGKTVSGKLLAKEIRLGTPAK